MAAIRGMSMKAVFYGVQITNQRGVVEFSSIYSGWYVGRANHIHRKVHIGGARAADTYSGGHLSHTSSIVHLEKASSANGLVATLNMAIDPELTPRPVGRAGRGQEVRRRAAN